MKRWIFLLPIVALAIFTSCQRFDELEGISAADFEAQYALPLINTELSLKDVLEKAQDLATIIVDPDGLIRFQYRGEVLTQTSDRVFQQINATLSGVPIPVLSKRTALQLQFPDGLAFDRLVLGGGTIKWSFQHKHPEPVQFQLRLPQVTKNGEILTFNASLPAYSGTGNPPTYLLSLANPTDLTGYEVVPDPITDSVYVEYELLRPGGLPDTAHLVGIIFENLLFSYMEGYLGGLEYEGGRDTIIIDFFDNWVRGDIYFEEPTVVFNIENSFGIPTKSKINVFEVFTVRGDILPLESPFVTNGIDFPYPDRDEVGQIKTKSFVFNKQNSNIDVILGSGPLAIDYDVNAITNPDGNTGIPGFITDSSYYRVQIEVDLPLYGKALDFLARDTFEVSFENYKNVRNAEFKLVTENGLPLDVAIQGYFLDEAGITLDSLFDAQRPVVKAAPVNSNGIPISRTDDVSFIDYPDARFDQIREARRLAIIASFSTYNEGQQSVKILADQAVRIKLGVILGVGF